MTNEPNSPIVLGGELAAAHVRERDRQAANSGPSLLDDLRYARRSARIDVPSFAMDPLDEPSATWPTSGCDSPCRPALGRTICKRHPSTPDIHPHQRKRQKHKRTSEFAHPSDTPLRSWQTSGRERQ